MDDPKLFATFHVLQTAISMLFLRSINNFQTNVRKEGVSKLSIDAISQPQTPKKSIVHEKVSKSVNSVEFGRVEPSESSRRSKSFLDFFKECVYQATKWNESIDDLKRRDNIITKSKRRLSLCVYFIFSSSSSSSSSLSSSSSSSSTDVQSNLTFLSPTRKSSL